MTGIIKMVHRAEHPDGPFLTIGEVAEFFERDRKTIKRWCQRLCEQGYEIPTHQMELGDEDSSAFVWLYTEADVRRLERYSEGINPKGGRPRKEPVDSGS